MVPVLLPPERGLFLKMPAVLIQRPVQIRSSAGDLAPQSGSTSIQRQQITTTTPLLAPNMPTTWARQRWDTTGFFKLWKL